MVCNKPAYVLIDPGAIHYFIFYHFASCLDRNPSVLGFDLVVSTPKGDSIIGSTIYNSCPVLVHKHHFVAELVVVNIKGFDVILGMDWLAKYHASVDCFEKTVSFNIPGQTPFTFKIQV